MKKKMFKALGLMSGTSMDGIDASIIKTDGKYEYSVILNKYFEYDKDLYEKLINIRNKILSLKDLKIQSKKIHNIEKEITLFHAKVVQEILDESKQEIDFIGLHGQTIFHDVEKKITKQLGDGKLLSQLTKKTVVYDFRQNDLKNGGQAAPLTPIFHNAIVNKINKKYGSGFPIGILNIGGISNLTNVINKKNTQKNLFFAYDIGPGNCLIDDWIRKNSKEKYDKDGLIAKSGHTDNFILNQALENFNINLYDRSLDIKDFDISFVKGLTLADGTSTLTDFTGSLIVNGINHSYREYQNNSYKLLVCGGGRKNKYLINFINKKLINLNKKISLELIEKYGIDGDFVESQAFAYLAIRCYLNLPISYPKTTGCKIPLTGGVIVKNF